MSVYDDDEEAIRQRILGVLDDQVSRTGVTTTDAIAEAVASEIVRAVMRSAPGHVIPGPTAKRLGYGLTDEELRDWKPE